MLPLLLVVALLVMLVWPAFLAPATAWRGRARRGLALLALVGLPAAGWWAWRERATLELASWITPYPQASERAWVPPSPGSEPVRTGAHGTWVFETADPPGAVLGFHRERAGAEGWRLTGSTDETLVLERNGRELFVWASVQRPGATTVVYQLTPPPD